MGGDDSQKLRPWKGTTVAPLTAVEVAHILWSGEHLSNRGGKLLKIGADCLRDSMAVQGLKDDCPIMSGHDSLTKRLCQVSPYAGPYRADHPSDPGDHGVERSDPPFMDGVATKCDA